MDPMDDAESSEGLPIDQRIYWSPIDPILREHISLGIFFDFVVVFSVSYFQPYCACIILLGQMQLNM